MVDFITVLGIELYPQVFNPFNKSGRIYEDYHPDTIDCRHYLRTTQRQDTKALVILREMVKEQEAMPYRLVGGTCISFSHDMFRFFKEEFSNEK